MSTLGTAGASRYDIALDRSYNSDSLTNEEFTVYSFSCFGSAGTAGTFGSATGCLGTAGSLGTFGCLACEEQKLGSSPTG